MSNKTGFDELCCQDNLQEAFYGACRAQQLLLDGHHKDSWASLERVTDLLRDLVVRAEQGALSEVACFLTARQVLVTRTSLFKLRHILATSATRELPPLIQSDGQEIDLQHILQRVQHDITVLERLGQVSDFVEPQAALFRAICRSLAGGRLDLTEHLFNKRFVVSRCTLH